jgi:Zn-dependent protease with chaperone function
MSKFFYNLGRKASPHVRKAKWIWQSVAGSQADAVKAEYDLGILLAAELRQNLTPAPDPIAKKLIAGVGQKLTARLTSKLRRFSFEVVMAREPNAFALPGGFIFVTTPLLDICGHDPDQIAFILAHEMAHVIKSHAINRIISDSAISIGSKAARIRGPLAGWIKTTGIKLLQSSYSQDMELEADAFAARLIKAARFDPAAGQKLLAHLQQLKNPPTKLDLGAYFSTHPPITLRIQKLKT